MSKISKNTVIEGKVITANRMIGGKDLDEYEERTDFYLEDASGAQFEIKGKAFEAVRPLVGQKVSMMISREVGHKIEKIKDAAGKVVFSDDSNVIPLNAGTEEIPKIAGDGAKFSATYQR